MPEEDLLLEGEGGEPMLEEPILDEGGNPILPEVAVRPEVPPVPVTPVIALCPGVECCEVNPFEYQINSTPGGGPTISIGDEVICSVCFGEPYTNYITADGLGIGLTWTIESGTLPIGLTFHGGYNEEGRVLIDGTPNSPGSYTITVKATAPNGSSGTGTFTLNVMQIVTTSLPDYEIGTPYYFQLTATGGSGNYGWEITSGALPDGLILNPVAGVISGTPTGIDNGTQPITFMVSDITCEEFNPVFTPTVTFVTSSNTAIATILGYPEYIASTPPKKYHKLTWSGTAEQFGHWASPEPTWQEYLFAHGLPPDTSRLMADVKYVYSGTGAIDSTGLQISNYSKNLFNPCGTVLGFKPPIDFATSVGFDIPPTGTLSDYCWPLDPSSCPSCSFPPVFAGDTQLNNTLDLPADIFGSSIGLVLTPTTLIQNNVIGSRSWVLVEGLPNGVTNVPKGTINTIFAPWVDADIVFNLSATLSEEYTDAEALANAQHIISNGRTAENFPRTTGFVSRFTSVNYDLNAANLIIGASYKITVTFTDNNFVKTTTDFTFLAVAATHTVNAQIPTPPTGGTLKISSATISIL